MFGFFRKNRSKYVPPVFLHSREDVIELLGAFISNLYANKHQNERLTMLKIKNKFADQDLDERIIDAVYDLVESLNTNSLIGNREFVQLNIENINDIIELSQDDIENGNILSNMQKSHTINNELFSIEVKMSQTKEKMEQALESGNKLLWTRLKNNRDSLSNEHKLKTQVSSSLSKKTQNLQIESSVKETQDTLKELAKDQQIDIQEVIAAINDNGICEKMIADENEQMAELMNDLGINCDDQFEIAQREHLLLKATNDFVETQKLIKVDD